MACGLLIVLVMIAIFWSWPRGHGFSRIEDLRHASDMLRHQTRHSAYMPECTRQTRRFGTSSSGRTHSCLSASHACRCAVRAACRRLGPLFAHLVHGTAPWQRFACIEIRLFDFCIFLRCLSFNLRGADNLIVHAARRAAAAASRPAGSAAGCLGGSVMEALGPCAPSRASGPAARASFAFRRIDWRVMKGATIMHRALRSRPIACVTELEFRWCWWRTWVGTCPRHCIGIEVAAVG